jgi:Zn-dependent oligopeptidase
MQITSPRERDFNKEVADKFKDKSFQRRNRNPMILYKRFRGHEPSPDALLKSRINLTFS